MQDRKIEPHQSKKQGKRHAAPATLSFWDILRLLLLFMMVNVNPGASAPVPVIRGRSLPSPSPSPDNAAAKVNSPAALEPSFAFIIENNPAPVLETERTMAMPAQNNEAKHAENTWGNVLLTRGAPIAGVSGAILFLILAVPRILHFCVSGLAFADEQQRRLSQRLAPQDAYLNTPHVKIIMRRALLNVAAKVKSSIKAVLAAKSLPDITISRRRCLPDYSHMVLSFPEPDGMLSYRDPRTGAPSKITTSLVLIAISLALQEHGVTSKLGRIKGQFQLRILWSELFVESAQEKLEKFDEKKFSDFLAGKLDICISESFATQESIIAEIKNTVLAALREVFGAKKPTVNLKCEANSLIATMSTPSFPYRGQHIPAQEMLTAIGRSLKEAFYAQYHFVLPSARSGSKNSAVILRVNFVEALDKDDAPALERAQQKLISKLQQVVAADWSNVAGAAAAPSYPAAASTTSILRMSNFKLGTQDQLPVIVSSSSSSSAAASVGASSSNSDLFGASSASVNIVASSPRP